MLKLFLGITKSPTITLKGSKQFIMHAMLIGNFPSLILTAKEHKHIYYKCLSLVISV